MRCKASCIGINYPGTDFALAGCVNDAEDWAAYLGSLGFSVGLLTDSQATKTSIIGAIMAVVQSLGPGDVGVIQFSGHGTWVPDLNGDEPDGRDEAICPVDMGDDGHNLVIDDEINMLLDSRAAGSRVVLITDCCHSGTIFRLVGPFDGTARKIRYLPPAHFARNPHFLSAVHRLGPTGPHPSDAPLPGVIHYAACKDNEYSYDAEFHGRGNGAFTYNALRAAKALPQVATYADWFRAIHAQLPSASYPQSPRFNAVKADRTLPLFT